VLLLGLHVRSQPELVDLRLDRLDESLDERPLDARPVGQFVDHRLVVLPHEVDGRPDPLLAATRRAEDVGEVRIEGKLLRRERLDESLPVEVGDGRIHLLDRDVGPPRGAHRLDVSELPGHPVHVLQFREGPPPAVLLAPVGPRGEPHRESLREVLVRVLLGVPAVDVAHEALRERHGPVVLPVGPAKRPEELAPLRRLVEAIRVVEGVSRLVTQVHHDLALVFEVVHLLLESRELRVGEVEGDSDHRLTRRAAPLVREVAERAEFPDSLSIQLAVEPLDRPLERRSFELEAQLLDRLGEDFLDVWRRFFEGLQGSPKRVARKESGARGRFSR
jgi:hypothetical protein